MKYIVVVLLLFSNYSFGQIISGTLKDEGRKVLDNPNFIINGRANGYAKYELAVDRNGNVTSARKVKTNIRSTPTLISVKNHVNKFKFEKGTYYPKFHHVVVKITVVKEKIVLEKISKEK